MLQLCARLSAHSITTVRKYSRDLAHHVTPPVDGNLLFRASFRVIDLRLFLSYSRRPTCFHAREEAVMREKEVEFFKTLIFTVLLRNGLEDSCFRISFALTVFIPCCNPEKHSRGKRGLTCEMKFHKFGFLQWGPSKIKRFFPGV